ncbi:MAG: tetratricopeptide repeat protein [Candidatus Peribacteraceae bacterium]|jgi:tetratricopeptide (TPR) repeat protein|nr:tetratricopeptide repeat protein [Candidatus Peribacteraceae bacterium]
MQQAATVTVASPSPRAQRWAVGLLILVGLVTYLPSLLQNGFVDIDDGLLITRNANVLHLTLPTLWAGFTTFDPELYVPLTFVSYQLEAALFGVHPFVFHLTNLLLHIGTALLVFAVIRRLAARHFPADAFLIGYFCALVFALHPLNTEAVVWAAARKDVLSAFFFCAALLFFLRFRTDLRRRTYVWSVVFFLLALLSKVSVLMFPFILLLVDAAEGREGFRTGWKEKMPFFGLSLLFGLIALFGKQTQLTSLSLFEKGLLACKATVFYLRAIFWPAGLTIFHPQEMPIALSRPDLWAPPLVVLAMLAVALVCYRRHRLISFGIAFYLLLLLPSFITFWKNGFVYFASERYAYVPMVGILFAFGVVLLPPLRKTFQQRSFLWRIIGLTTGMLFIVTLGGLTLRQSLTWHDPVALNERALLVNPRSAHALNNLGSASFAAGQYREALALFDRALAIDPALPAAHANRGQALLKLGDTDGALKAFATGIDSLPNNRPPLPQDLSPFLDLAQLLDALGRSQEAEQVLRGAIQHLPGAPLPHYYLGVKEQQFGRLPEALVQFRLATDLDPRLADAFYRLAAVAAETGQLSEAMTALERVLELDPGNELAREHLENIRSLLAE